jgi:hypothetical protein
VAVTLKAPHIISARLTNEEAARWATWRAATPENTSVAVMRLILSDPDVIARMEELLWPRS